MPRGKIGKLSRCIDKNHRGRIHDSQYKIVVCPACHKGVNSESVINHMKNKHPEFRSDIYYL